MIRIRLLRRAAIAAICFLAFAQAAAAMMGCSTLARDPARGVAVMPSGEPCPMLGDAPAAMVIKHAGGEEGSVAADAPFPPAPALALLTLPAAPVARAAAARDAALQRPLWPPAVILFARRRD
ncbi:MAG: hypothetical protein JNM79_25525 [Burkholderiales bacterium]|nr:hypothetical protein [Burkholderiales bacterium]